ncbi:hypothetical protein EO087_10130 [Dyella sp. M7H15-1]|uniref:hypothetical protein n=1 Tax=Dyella sp. M7H15-1 TaxID=2501295 RepID=UPI0010050F88|nr:hypothetical protein [Dyella sp. M7H15-1]QAU24305.1 hypothetical protein EO087_10130 [Dyella sp. M7H15-1]
MGEVGQDELEETQGCGRAVQMVRAKGDPPYDGHRDEAPWRAFLGGLGPDISHKRAGTSEIHAKFDPDYLGKAATALEAMMQDLAALVPKLAWVIAGPVKKASFPSVDTTS